METLGRHLLVDFHGCDPALLDDPAHLETALRLAAECAGATVLGASFHRFSPCGVTGVLVLRESHLAIHTWPERAFAAADLFTCGRLDPWLAGVRLKEALRARRAEAVELPRGGPPLEALSRPL